MSFAEEILMYLENDVRKIYYTGENINSAFFDHDSASVIFELGENATLNLKVPQVYKIGGGLFVLINGEEVSANITTDDCFYYTSFETKTPEKLEIIFAHWAEATERTDNCETFVVSPLKQVKLGITLDEIQCKETLVLIQKYDGSPACVKSSTEWELIDRGWTTVTFSEDKIDVKQITGAKILNFSFDDYNKSIIIQIDSFSNGQLIITIPRNVLDSKINGIDDDFFVLIDGEESDFQETKNAIERTFTIPFENGTNTIEITIPTQI